ncbi:MAG: 16S rRNA (guanine(527)-N(7))-methyltransferase RsmG [Deltaproteobacteria bacterium]|nr:16S rRNA (guanine(527)-N(7))-methyltransferase RsmG [Deltaproteobacteria bacterium]
MTESEQELLRRTAAGLGVALTGSQLEGLLTYLDELCLWNRRTNLTGLRSRKRMVVELLADALVPAPRLPPSARLLDVGSGAGLPGIPLKIVRPDLSIDLLEPSLKRHHFLKQAIRLLRMEHVQALRGRVEDSAGLLRPCYDVVTARAVWGLRQAVEMCAPLVAKGGMLVGFAGSNAGAELTGARASLAGAGLHLEDAVDYRLPGTGGDRRTFFFRKGAIP